MLSVWKIIVAGSFIFSSLLFFAGEAAAQKKTTGQFGMPMGGQPLKPAQKAPASKETYSIVDVSNEYQVVPKSGLTNLKKQIDDEYKNALKAYKLAKKDKNNKDVKLEEPKKKTIKTVKSGIKTQEKAQEDMQKLVEEREKNNKKGRG